MQFRTQSPYLFSQLHRPGELTGADPARKDALWFAVGLSVLAVLFSGWAYGFGDSHDQRFADIAWIIAGVSWIYALARMLFAMIRREQPRSVSVIVHFAESPNGASDSRAGHRDF